MREDLDLRIRYSSTFSADRCDLEARVRTTAYERMCEGPVVAVPGSSSEHKKQGLGVRFILKSHRQAMQGLDFRCVPKADGRASSTNAQP